MKKVGKWGRLEKVTRKSNHGVGKSKFGLGRLTHIIRSKHDMTALSLKKSRATADPALIYMDNSIL
jgi:hypothetical protein